MDEEGAFQGTSASMKECGAEATFKRAKKEGMNLSVYVQDGDSSSSKAVYNTVNWQ